MDRKALIISNPGEVGEENYCDGVSVDVANYINYLTSPLGGAWYRSEIIHLDRPTSTEVDKQIKLLKGCDYAFIAFCGHGYYSFELKSTILILRKHIELDSLSLRSGAN